MTPHQDRAATPNANFTSAETEIAQSTEGASSRAQFTGRVLAFDIERIEGVVYVHTQPLQSSAELEREFYRLAEQWRKETKYLSLASDKANNFALHQIIGMGEQAIPLILRQLQSKTTDWFWALRAIARGRAPVIPSEDQGKVRRIADIWIQWGRDHGYLGS